MSRFGWSLPPGCGSLPGEESAASELKVEGLPKHVCVFWVESEQVQLMLYEDGDERLLATADFVWDDDLDEAQNFARATTFAREQFKSFLTLADEPPTPSGN